MNRKMTRRRLSGVAALAIGGVAALFVLGYNLHWLGDGAKGGEKVAPTPPPTVMAVPSTPPSPQAAPLR